MFKIVKVFQRRASSSLYVVTRSRSDKVTNGASTVDKNEVNFFGDISKDWWDESGPIKALHAMNHIRVQFIRSGLINTGHLKEKSTLENPTYLKGFRIADVGCGGGILSLNLGRLGCNVVGIEPSSDLVSIGEQAVAKYRPSGEVKFIATSVEDYASNNSGLFDAVVCSEVIEHVSTKEPFIQACTNLLKPGGSIFMTTPNQTLPSRIFNIFVAETLRILPPGSHQYEKFISPQQLSQILDKCGCETVMTSGFMYNPVDNSFCWTSTTALHYALHAVKH